MGVMTDPHDCKELTPEFYAMKGDFLVCPQKLHLANDLDEKPLEVLENVELPLWADSVADFLRKMRAALESDYVSAHLHQWIDLVFGFKQSG